ncbi:MAG: glycine zipper 2TM domain-containing protein [Lysobacterales bacterium]|nr:glycine zipper 2TM domain-containing protein [Xanthomonadales bacterium]
MRTQLSTFTVAALLVLSSVALVSPADAGHRQPQERHDRDGRREICQECGTVRDISRISSGSRRSNTGAIVVGALIGGALGNQVGKGDGRKAATVAGAVAGGVVGNKVSKDKHRKTIYRISVRMDNGRVYSFDQGSSNHMRPGSRVVVQNGRVYPADQR